MFCKSVPALGSVRQIPPRGLPSANPGRNRRFCCSVPNRTSTSHSTEWLPTLGHGDFEAPGLAVNAGIVDRRAVENRVAIGACEPLDHVQIRSAHSGEITNSETALIVESEIGGVDDQRVPLPTAAGI